MLVEGLSPLPRLSKEPRKASLEVRMVFNRHCLPIKSSKPRKSLAHSPKDVVLPVLVSRVVLRLNDHPTAHMHHRFTPDLSLNRSFLERQLVPLRSRVSPSPHHSPEPLLCTLRPPKPRVQALVSFPKPLSPWKTLALDPL